jgi:hypothetical protein
VSRARARAACTAGISNAISMAIIPNTTNISTSDSPRLKFFADTNNFPYFLNSKVIAGKTI